MYGVPHEVTFKVKLAIIQTRIFSHQKGTQRHVFLYNICRIYMSYYILFEGACFVLSYSTHTVRLLTHVLCKPTHFFFHSFIATISYSPQISFSSVMKDWADKYHVRGTPTRSPSRLNSQLFEHAFFSH